MAIVGHRIQREFLRRLVRCGNIPHAFLFSGVEAVGKKTLALEFFASFADPAMIQGDPDLFVVEPEKEIKIGKVREVEKFLGLKPFSSPFKRVLIDGADKMNPEAQNCLLKTLEEPPANSLIILVSSAPKMLFRTVLSRCQFLKFHPLSENEMRLFLVPKVKSEEQLEKIIFFSEGKPGRAAEFLKEPAMVDNYCKGLAKISRIVNSDIVSRFYYLKKFFATDPEHGKVVKMLELFLKYFRTLFLLKLGIGNFSFLNPFFLEGCQSFSLPQIKNILEDLEQVRILISQTNVDQKLALENLFLKI